MLNKSRNLNLNLQKYVNFETSLSAEAHPAEGHVVREELKKNVLCFGH
jgi:hypothetical protein